jgi:hypothetical protein
MPELIYSSEKLGCGATIKLDSGEVCVISVAQSGVLIRSYRHGSLFGSWFGPILYNEKAVYKAAKTAMLLSARYSQKTPLPAFKNPVLSAFANAVWHCSSAGEAAVVINQAAEAA